MEEPRETACPNLNRSAEIEGEIHKRKNGAARTRAAAHLANSRFGDGVGDLDSGDLAASPELPS